MKFRKKLLIGRRARNLGMRTCNPERSGRSFFVLDFEGQGDDVVAEPLVPEPDRHCVGIRELPDGR